MDFERELDVLRATILLAHEIGAVIASRGGSTILVQQDPSTDGKILAALAVRVEYADTPEEAVSKLTATIRELIDARKKEIEGVLPEAGPKLSKQG